MIVNARQLSVMSWPHTGTLDVFTGQSGRVRFSGVKGSSGSGLSENRFHDCRNGGDATARGRGIGLNSEGNRNFESVLLLDSFWCRMFHPCGVLFTVLMILLLCCYIVITVLTFYSITVVFANQAFVTRVQCLRARKRTCSGPLLVV